MIDLKRILTATDFSQASQVALQYAAAFAKAFGAEVILCHVLEKPDFLSSLPPVSEGYFPPNLAEIQEKHARVQCEQVLAEAGLSQARVLLLHGSPAGEITKAAASENGRSDHRRHARPRGDRPHAAGFGRRTGRAARPPARS